MVRPAPASDGDPRAAASAAVELVVAVSENDVIGRRNQLPWRLSGDLRHFKALTVGKPVLMGRRTFESIGRPLPDRINLVVTRSRDFRAEGCTVVDSLGAALRAAGDAAAVMVIGGADVYGQCLPAARRIFLTLVHAEVADGDTYFSGWRDSEWLESARERHEADERNDHAYSFITLERRPTAGRPPG